MKRRILGMLIVVLSAELSMVLNPGGSATDIGLIVGIATAFLIAPLGITLALFPYGDGCHPGAGMQ